MQRIYVGPKSAPKNYVKGKEALVKVKPLEISGEPIKPKKGRPRKHPLLDENAIKPKRGRPKKTEEKKEETKMAKSKIRTLRKSRRKQEKNR